MFNNISFHTKLSLPISARRLSSSSLFLHYYPALSRPFHSPRCPPSPTTHHLFLVLLYRTFFLPLAFEEYSTKITVVGDLPALVSLLLSSDCHSHTTHLQTRCDTLGIFSLEKLARFWSTSLSQLTVSSFIRESLLSPTQKTQST